MSDLIDRQELLNNRPEYLNPQMEDEIQSARHQGWNDCNSYYYDLIIKQAKVDIEQHAHWIPLHSDVRYVTAKCSKCFSSKSENFICVDDESDFYPYCPYCGAKMDGEVKKNEKRL